MPLIKYNNQSLSSITTLPASIPTGKLKLISSQTASNSASISFTTGLNSTYKIYKFVFVNIKSISQDDDFRVNFSTDGGSNYNVTKTTTMFQATHNEADTTTSLQYQGGRDLAQSTADQWLPLGGINNDADNVAIGYMYLYNPASTTYVKHFMAQSNSVESSNLFYSAHCAGYCNTTSAVNAVIFRMQLGNFSGTIYLYAIDNS